MSEPIFFSGWDVLLRTVIVAATAYPGMLLMLRISGARTLAQLNAFDLIVTVALGSTLATVLISKDVALAQGLVAFALLIIMQFILSWAATRSKYLQAVVIGEPTLLLFRGQLLRDALQRCRISEEEVGAAVRSKKLAGFADVEAVVLETNGKISVVPASTQGASSALEFVPHYTSESTPQL